MQPTHQSKPASKYYSFKNLQWAVVRQIKLDIIVKYLKMEALQYVKCMPILPECLKVESYIIKKRLTLRVLPVM